MLQLPRGNVVEIFAGKLDSILFDWAIFCGGRVNVRRFGIGVVNIHKEFYKRETNIFTKFKIYLYRMFQNTGP